MQTFYSSLAQSVEHSAVNRVVVGSSPTGGVQTASQNNCKQFSWRESDARHQDLSCLHIRLLGQAVKTSPFHGGNTGSIPVGVIQVINLREKACRCGSIGRAADL